MNKMIDKNKKIAWLAAFTVTALYLLGSYLILKENPNYLFQVLVKTTATCIVFMVVAWNLKGIKGWSALYPAIIFCIAGDVLLGGLQLSPYPELVFQLGVASFFVGYLIIAITLLKKANDIVLKHKLIIFSVTICFGIMQYLSITVTGMMAAIVIAYIAMTTILLTGGTSYLLLDIKNNAYFFGTGLMFYISDSMIAQKVFGGWDVPMAEILIMLTYGVGHSCLMLATSQLKASMAHK